MVPLCFSDDGLTLEKSALQTRYSGQFSLIAERTYVFSDKFQKRTPPLPGQSNFLTRRVPRLLAVIFSQHELSNVCFALRWGIVGRFS